jgi:hypothetical protein
MDVSVRANVLCALSGLEHQAAWGAEIHLLTAGVQHSVKICVNKLWAWVILELLTLKRAHRMPALNRAAGSDDFRNATWPHPGSFVCDHFHHRLVF